MAVVEIAKIAVRRGLGNTTGIPQLDAGEFGWATDAQTLYIGNGVIGPPDYAPEIGNTRILTENDYANLENLFSAALYGSNIVATTSSYRYRDGDTALQYVSTTTIAAKLDTTVSLVDYFGDPRIPSSILVGSTGTDITTVLNNAIQDLFNNPVGPDTRRQLKIPAGVYTVSPSALANGDGAGFFLPPYTTLIGEGADLTTLLLANTATSMFQTVDAIGNTFNNMVLTSGKPRYINLENMTLSYTTSSNIKHPLVEIDLATDVSLKNIKFNSQILNSHNTLTDIITSFGTAIYMRGADYQLPNEQCKNITIENCEFTNIGVGVAGTGTIVDIKIDNNIFENLQQGINFGADPTDASGSAPSNGIITRNRFKNIVKQAIFVGTSTNRANHISQKNIFYQVGNNGLYVNDGTVTTSSNISAIISFYGEGCRSQDDEFSRRNYAYSIGTSTVNAFYYNSLVEGKTTIENGGVYTASINILNNTDGVTSNLDLLYVPDGNQLINVPYTLYDSNNNYSRTGNLTINIASEANNFVGTLTIESTLITGTVLTLYNIKSSSLFTLTNTSSWLLSLDNTPAIGDSYILADLINSITTISASSNSAVLYANTSGITVGDIIIQSSNNYELGSVVQLSANEIEINELVNVPAGTVLSVWSPFNNVWTYTGSQFVNIPYTPYTLTPQVNDILYYNGTPYGTFVDINYIGSAITATSTATYLMSAGGITALTTLTTITDLLGQQLIQLTGGNNTAIIGIDLSGNISIVNPGTGYLVGEILSVGNDQFLITGTSPIAPNLGDSYNVAASNAPNAVYQLWTNTRYGWQGLNATTTSTIVEAPNNFIIFNPYTLPSILPASSSTVTMIRNFNTFGSVSDYYNYSYTNLWLDATNDKNGIDKHPVFQVSTATNNYIQLQCTNYDSLTYYVDYQINILNL